MTCFKKCSTRLNSILAPTPTLMKLTVNEGSALEDRLAVNQGQEKSVSSGTWAIEQSRALKQDWESKELKTLSSNASSIF